jgi:hypothetical protein
MALSAESLHLLDAIKSGTDDACQPLHTLRETLLHQAYALAASLETPEEFSFRLRSAEACCGVARVVQNVLLTDP